MTFDFASLSRGRLELGGKGTKCSQHLCSEVPGKDRATKDREKQMYRMAGWPYGYGIFNFS